MYDQVAAVRLSSLIADEAAWRQRQVLSQENREKRHRAQHLCGGRFIHRTATGHLFVLHSHLRSTTENSRLLSSLKRKRRFRARRHNIEIRQRAWSASRLAYKSCPICPRHLSRKRKCAAFARRRRFRTEFRRVIEEAAKVTVDLGSNVANPSGFDRRT